MDSLPEDAANIPVNFYGSALDSNEEDNEEEEILNVTTEVRLYISSQHLSCFFLSQGIGNGRVNCICTGQCVRKRGRGACPCKAADLNCADPCKCVKSKCKNQVRDRRIILITLI